MSKIEQSYLDILSDVLHNGETRMDRTGVGTKSIFGKTLVHDLSEGFPLLTTKRVAWKAVASELLWFIEGSPDERRLAEILHGSRAPENKTIWTGNAEADYWAPRAQYRGHLGPVYGVQWRSWKRIKLKSSEDHLSHENGGVTYFGAKVLVEEIDQLEKLINTIKTDPTNRRMILSAYNVGELEDMALPPCHMTCQFYVSADNKLSCQMTQRSADLFLGIPFNIASYALLTHLIANSTGLDVGKLIINIGDAHIYLNHVDQVLEQLRRQPLPLPQIEILAAPGTSIEQYDMKDFIINGYDPHPPIKAPMAV